MVPGRSDSTLLRQFIHNIGSRESTAALTCRARFCAGKMFLTGEYLSNSTRANVSSTKINRMAGNARGVSVEAGLKNWKAPWIK